MSRRPSPQSLGPVRPSPVLTRAATELLGALAEGRRVFEFGSGGSTLYLAQRAAQVVSIEDDADWHRAVLDALAAHGLRADVRLVRRADIHRAIDDTGMWDVVCVDCRDQAQRAQAIAHATAHVAPGGWLVADDYEFPKVRRAVGQLSRSEWDIAVMAGHKIHPQHRRRVATQTAFCHRGPAR